MCTAVCFRKVQMFKLEGVCLGFRAAMRLDQATQVQRGTALHRGYKRPGGRSQQQGFLR
jgi:hypothetical protein